MKLKSIILLVFAAAHATLQAGCGNRTCDGEFAQGQDLHALPALHEDQRLLVSDRDEPRALCVDFHPSQRQLAVGYSDGVVRIWDYSRQRIIAACRYGPPVLRVAFSPDGMHLAAGGGNPTDTSAASPVDVLIFDLNDSRIVHRLGGHRSAILGLAYSHDGRWLVSGDVGEGPIRIWNTATGTQVGRIDSAFGADVHFSSHDRYLVSNGAFTWKLPRLPNDGRIIAMPRGCAGSAVISADERRLYGAIPALHTVLGMGGPGRPAELCIAVPDGREIECRNLARYGLDEISTIAISYSTGMLAIGGADIIVVWDTHANRAVARCPSRDLVGYVAFSPDGSRVAEVPSHSDSVILWTVHQ